MRVGITQAELSERIHYSQQYISDVKTGKKALSIEMAQKVSEEVRKEAKNIYGETLGYETVRPQWLLCMEEFKTDTEREDAVTDKRARSERIVEDTRTHQCVGKVIPFETNGFALQY